MAPPTFCHGEGDLAVTYTASLARIDEAHVHRSGTLTHLKERWVAVVA